jgi:hypothetical protein
MLGNRNSIGKISSLSALSILISFFPGQYILVTEDSNGFTDIMHPAKSQYTATDAFSFPDDAGHALLTDLQEIYWMN